MVAIGDINRCDGTELGNGSGCNVRIFFIRIQQITGNDNQIRLLLCNFCSQLCVVLTKGTVVQIRKLHHPDRI